MECQKGASIKREVRKKSKEDEQTLSKMPANTNQFH